MEKRPNCSFVYVCMCICDVLPVVIIPMNKDDDDNIPGFVFVGIVMNVVSIFGREQCTVGERDGISGLID